MITKVLIHRQVHWAEILAEYDFILFYISGKNNFADGLSYHPDYITNI